MMNNLFGWRYVWSRSELATIYTATCFEFLYTFTFYFSGVSFSFSALKVYGRIVYDMAKIHPPAEQ